VNLPSIASAQQGLTARSIVRIRDGRIVHVTSDESSSSFRIRWKSKDVHFSFEHLPVFLSLNDGDGHTVSDLLSGCMAPEDRLRSMGFLLELSTQGILEALPLAVQEVALRETEN